ncbi:hypothetical protein KC315_g4847 [Hortaea werneckii]|nr:hypothetical protein KC315_g4847 [Hortaea werneckii]
MSSTVYSMGSAPMIALLLAIGVPILTVPIITCAGIYCIRRWRRKQEQTKQKTKEQQPDEEASPTIPEIQTTVPSEAANAQYMRDARAASPLYNGRVNYKDETFITAGFGGRLGRNEAGPDAILVAPGNFLPLMLYAG